MATKATTTPPRPGDRVACVRNATATHVYLYVVGTYIGREAREDGDDAKIRLDDGQELYGAECYWSFERELAEITEGKIIEVVSIENERTMKLHVARICERHAAEITAKVQGLTPNSVAMARIGPTEAMLVASFTYQRKMTAVEIAEIDALTQHHHTNGKKPS